MARRPQPRSAGYRSFAVVFEDDHLLVVAKPSGLLTNQAESAEQTLQDQVRRHAKKSALQPTAVHRLDRFTSGLVLFGKTQSVLEALNAMVRAAALEKRYWVLVCGKPETSGRIDAGLERTDEGKRKMRISNAAHAQASLTEYAVEELVGDYALVNTRILTGRTHQIRVHFAHIGHPVAGDNIYGNKQLNADLRQQHGLQRQFIHARELVFKHPVTGELLQLTAKLPKDLSRVLKSLRGQPGHEA